MFFLSQSSFPELFKQDLSKYPSSIKYYNKKKILNEKQASILGLYFQCSEGKLKVVLSKWLRNVAILQFGTCYKVRENVCWGKGWVWGVQLGNSSLGNEHWGLNDEESYPGFPV